MKLALVIPVLNHRDETIACVESFKSTADNWHDIELLIVDNGSTIPASEWGIEGTTLDNFLRFETNQGVLPAQDAAYRHTNADYIFFTHNDVTMFERGWDTKVIQEIEGINAGHSKGIGVAGFFGSKGLGTPEVYVYPYVINQLVRVENVSGCTRMPAAHGYRPVNGRWESVAVLDGFSLIISRAFLDEQEGFDKNLPPHHMYDNHTCLQAIDRGYMNIVIPMDALHHGGVTDVSEDWSKGFGKTKSEIHQDAHYPYFYNYWKPGSEQEEHSYNIYLPFRA